LANHVVGHTENWNFRSCPLSSANRGISAGQNDIHVRLYQFGRMLLELRHGEIVTTGIDHEVLPHDEAEPT
jgi:hypothetical protein